MEIRWKKTWVPPVPHIKGHSRSSELTQIDRLPVISRRDPPKMAALATGALPLGIEHA